MLDDFSSKEINATYPFNSRSTSWPSIFVKDANLQVSVPGPSQAASLDQTHTFKDVLNDYFQEVNTLQHDADSQIQKFVAGETENIHEVMLALDEAKTAFDMMMEIRNQLVKSYEQITRGG
jgi:flagellar hook-basal body complex protein FliE